MFWSCFPPLISFFFKVCQALYIQGIFKADGIADGGDSNAFAILSYSEKGESYSMKSEVL